jgi:hypothetical protein
MFRIKRSAGVFHSETEPAIETASGLKQWFFNGKLHRANHPAVETALGGRMYFWRGVLVSKEIACGELSDPQAIMGIKNIEQRRCAMERVGYLVFKKFMKKIDQWQDMYELYSMNIPEDEPLRILTMRDPSLGMLYAIRVNPAETDCRLAVAHSYDCKTWEEYTEGVVWV